MTTSFSKAACDTNVWHTIKVIQLRLGGLLFFQQNLCKQGAHPLPFACQLATITLLNNMFIIGRIVEWRWSL